MFLLGIDALLESEDDLCLSPDQKAELLGDHTRQLYMAFSRAAERLVIICPHSATEELLERLFIT